jgi:serine protease
MLRSILLAACLAASSLSAVAADGFFVRLHATPAKEDAAQRKQRLDAAIQERRWPLTVRGQATARWMHLAPEGALTPAAREALLRALRADPRVAEVLPEQREFPLSVTPNDPRYAEQWWLQPRAAGSTGVAGFSSAWLRRAAGVPGPVAVLDSGISFHPDLFANVLDGYDFVSNPIYAGDGDGRDANPNDEGDAITDADRADRPAEFSGCPEQPRSGWHGTVIAGQIGAMTDNSNGVAGAGFNAGVVPVRVAGKCGAAQGDIVAGMRWAAGLAVDGVPANPNPARVIVVSYGSEAACDAVYADALAEVRAAGALVVVAAGNLRRGVFRPANCADAFAVTSLNREGYKAFYANFGPEIALATPGGDDTTGSDCDAQLADGGLVSTGNLGDTVQGAAGYAAASGTSFAAPAVAATAALMLRLNPALTRDQLVAGLRASAAPFVQVPLLGNCGPDNSNIGRCTCTGSSCGAGMLDADQALAYALAPTTYLAPVRTAPELRDSRIETCARILGLPVPPVTPPVTPPTNPGDGDAGGSGGGGTGSVLLMGLLLATWVLRRGRG